MGAKAVGQMHALRIKWGGPVDGTPNWDAAWTTVLGKKRTSGDQSVAKSDVTALEDPTKFYQPTHGDATMAFDVLVPIGGRQFKDKQGHYLTIEYQATPTAAAETYVGFAEKIPFSGEDGPQIETIQFQQGANGAGN